MKFFRRLIEEYKQTPAGIAAQRHPELAFSSGVLFVIGSILLIIVSWKLFLGIIFVLWGNNLNEYIKRI